MVLRLSAGLKNICVRGLAESMDIRTMTHVAREIFPAYDIHERTGFPPSMSIPNLDVASQIVTDVLASGKFLSFVRLLISAQDDGIMGKRYPISFLREIIKGTYDLGFVFDSVNGLFTENPSVRRSRNWGALEEGVEYPFAFLAIDIAGNSRLVKSYPKTAVDKTYADLRKLVSDSIDRRNGRIWNWEGDGGLVAFFFGEKHTSAVLSAMEIINELFIYNRTSRVLDEPLVVRVGVHGGSCEYSANMEHLHNLDTIAETYNMESVAKPNSVTISIVVKVMLDEFISQHFRAVGTKKNGPFCYQLEME